MMRVSDLVWATSEAPAVGQTRKQCQPTLCTPLPKPTSRRSGSCASNHSGCPHAAGILFRIAITAAWKVLNVAMVSLFTTTALEGGTWERGELQVGLH